jgi:hypothetical protein
MICFDNVPKRVISLRLIKVRHIGNFLQYYKSRMICPLLVIKFIVFFFHCDSG